MCPEQSVSYVSSSSVCPLTQPLIAKMAADELLFDAAHVGAMSISSTAWWHKPQGVAPVTSVTALAVLVLQIRVGWSTIALRQIWNLRRWNKSLDL